jgi:hypothetical protein
VVRWAEYEGLDDEETTSAIDLIERIDLEEHKLEAKKFEEGKGGGAKASKTRG